MVEENRAQSSVVYAVRSAIAECLKGGGPSLETVALRNVTVKLALNSMAAGNSWQVILKDDGKVAWVTVEDGVSFVKTPSA